MSSAASGPASGESIRRHSRSFSFASRLLPAAKRADVERLYAWCRWCDDGVDTAAAPQEALEFVDQAAEDVRRITAGTSPVAPESLWLAELVGRHALPIEAASALLEGMRSDLTPAAGFHEADLWRYCFRVAGAVGVLMCPILGLQDRRHLPHAAALGMGMRTALSVHWYSLVTSAVCTERVDCERSCSWSNAWGYRGEHILEPSPYQQLQRSPQAQPTTER
jgi:phytoene synthase